jgi:uncharacterized protein with gpF-like domain
MGARHDRIDFVGLVGQAQDMAELEQALAEAVQAVAAPADVASILDFLEIPASGAFDVAPEQAIGYFKAKGLKATFSYADMLDYQHDQAFTVAKMMDIDMLGQVRASLDAAMANGTAFKEWTKEITPVLQSGGWWGRKQVIDPLTGQEIVAQLGSPWRLETIFRTNMQTAYAAGAWQEIVDQKDLAPLLMYDAVDDFRTRPLHAAWDRKVVAVDSAWWQTHYPPNGYNSVVPDQRVRGAAMLGLKAFYAGEVVEVTGASGGRFTVTAQHPVLTTRGWVDAKALREGDELVAYSGEVGGGAVPADQHEDDAPPTIEEVFDALALCARAAVPRAALHLNGDAAFFEGDVEVVGADRELVHRLQAAALEFVAKVDLLQSGQAAAFGARLRSLVAFAFAHVAVSRGDSRLESEAGQAVRAVLQQLGSHRIRFDPVRSKVTSDVLSTLAQALPDLAQAHSLFVEAENFLRDWFADLGSLAPAQPITEQHGALLAGPLDARIADDPIGGFGVNANAAGDILHRHAGAVQIDRVASLRISHYEGHVYDLQTKSGTMVLHGGLSLPQYVVSNCRCGVIQLSHDEARAMGLKETVDPPDDGTYTWNNPRTGEKMEIPNGLDPGFAHNSGKLLQMKNQLAKLAQEKAQALAPDMAAAAQKSLADAETKKVIDGLTSDAARAQQKAAAAQGKAALERAKALAEEKALQWEAQEQLAAIAKGKESAGAGAAYKVKALAEAKKIPGWAALKPTEQLNQVLDTAAGMKVKADLSKGLSTYKKAILEGKNPPPAAVKAFKSLEQADADAFIAKVDAEKKAIEKAAADAAAKAAAEAAAKAQAAAPVKPAFVDTPAPDPATMVVIGRKSKGGTPGALYQDTATGQKWLVKFNGSADAVNNEVLASKLYNLAGVEAPDLHAITIDGKPALASRIVDGITEVPAKVLAATPSVTEGFAVDAWMANWDVAGLNFDNVVLVQGRALRIDVGGSLRYRAVGGLKGQAFGSKVNEIESLRDGTNAQARQVFGGMSAADIERSVEKVLVMADEDIRAVVLRYGPPDAADREALADLMIARKRDLERRFPAAAERVRARLGTAEQAPSQAARRVTAAEQEAVEASRVNGYGFSTDSDQIEDHQVVVHAFKRANGDDATRGFFKLLPGASKDLQQAIAASAGEAASVSLAAARQSILDAVKSINFRASKGEALDQKVVQRIQAMQRAVKDALTQLDSAIARADNPSALRSQRQVLEAWSSRVEGFLDDAAAGKKATQIPGQFPEKSIPDAMDYAPKAAPDAPSGVKWKRVSGPYQFDTARFDRSFAVENGSRATVSGTSLRYEAALPDGTTVVYFPHDNSVAWAMQGIVKIDVPGRGVDSTTRVFGTMNDIGLKSVRATEVDRQHLYLNAYARIALLRRGNALKTFEAITDRTEAGVQAKLGMLKAATGLDVEATEGWRQIDGVRQAFGHGRAYQLRPDLDDAEMRALDTTHILFHNPNTLGTDGGKNVFEKIKVVIDGGGTFASLTDRFRRGVPLMGSSVSRDLETGGGNYHFTRIRSRAHQAGSSGVYWRTSALRRMDAITYESDMFGSTAGNSVETYRRGQDVASFRAVAGTTSNETIFKGGMSIFDDLDRIVLASKAEVDEAIKWMQDKGYKAWPDGRPLAEVIITKDKHRAKP